MSVYSSDVLVDLSSVILDELIHEFIALLSYRSFFKSIFCNNPIASAAVKESPAPTVSFT